jgi:hypothetical protein
VQPSGGMLTMLNFLAPSRYKAYGTCITV